MKKILIALVLICSMSSCFEATQIQGNYSANNTFTSDRKIDSVWSSIIDLFSSKGISIKVIDKQSGLIVSENTSFMHQYTFEGKDGKLENENAWVVVERRGNGWGGLVQPIKLTGDWNIRVKELNNKTLVTVNLTNIDASFYIGPTTYSSGVYRPLNCKSTGVFEKFIFDNIK